MVIRPPLLKLPLNMLFRVVLRTYLATSVLCFTDVFPSAGVIQFPALQ